MMTRDFLERTAAWGGSILLAAGAVIAVKWLGVM